jgi:hypothetical protein
MKLEGSLSLSGKVLDPEGNPVPRASVHAQGEGDAAGSSGGAETDANGRFQLRALRKGLYRVGAQATYWSFPPDRDGTTVPAEVASIQAGKEDLELRLRRPAWIEGEVLDESGQPVTDAWVTATIRERVGVGSAKTDAKGHFRVMVGEDDVVELEAQGPRKVGGPSFQSEVRVPNVAPRQGPVVIHLIHEH